MIVRRSRVIKKRFFGEWTLVERCLGMFLEEDGREVKKRIQARKNQGQKESRSEIIKVRKNQDEEKSR